MVSRKIWMLSYQRVAALAFIIFLALFRLSITKQLFRFSTPPSWTISKAPFGLNSSTNATIKDTLIQCRELLAEAANLPSPASSSLRPLAPANDTTKTSTIANASSVPSPIQFCSSQILGEKQTWNHHKKVISYAIFGPSNKTNYNQTIPDWVLYGMEKNMLDAKIYFPDWIVRVYTFDVPQSLQDKWLVQNASMLHNVELVHCFSDTLMAKSTSRKMLSRFLAHDDPKVWYTLVRDADSRLSLREVMAVNEFIEASIASDNHVMHDAPHHDDDPAGTDPPLAIYFHVMHDHSRHVVPIMGGMFGMKRGLFEAALPNANITMTRLIDRALQEHPDDLGGDCGEDQKFLLDYVWPHVKTLTLTHDIQPRRCLRFRSRVCREFPLGPRDESINYFVGAPFKVEDEQQQWQTMRKQHLCNLQCKLTDESL